MVKPVRTRWGNQALLPSFLSHLGSKFKWGKYKKELCMKHKFKHPTILLRSEKSPSFLSHLVSKVKWGKYKKELYMKHKFKHPTILLRSEKSQMDFKTWLQVFISTCCRISEYTIPGTDLFANFVHDIIKKHSRSLASLVYDIHGAGFCLSRKSLREDNLCLSHGVIKLRHAYLLRYTPTRAKENFKQLRNFILKSLFKGLDWLTIPIDMWNFLDLLKDSPRKNEYVIRNHFALMNDKGRSAFICQWHNITDQYSQAEWDAYEHACAELPHLDDWIDAIEDIDAFEFAFGKGIYNGEDTDQPRWFRNCLQHLLQRCRGASKDRSIPPQFLSDDVVKMVIALHAESILSFPEILNKYGLLKAMKMDEYFYH